MTRSGKRAAGARTREGLKELSMKDLHTRVDKLKKQNERKASTLQRKREKLLDRVAQIDTQLRELGKNPGGKRRRAVNATPLPEALEAVLDGKQLSVTDAAEAVQKAGYKTHSSNFKIMVNMVLTKYPRKFKRIARGVYTKRQAA